MKKVGLSRSGTLLAVLLLLVSAAVIVPLGAQAQGKKLFGRVLDSSDNDPVAAKVTLVDAHAVLSPEPQFTTDVDNGYYEFTPPPGHYKLKVEPLGFTHFATETAPIRFDGTQFVSRNVTVTPIPDRDYYLNLTILDAQPTTVTRELVEFSEFARGPELVTDPDPLTDFNPTTGIASLDTKPLKWFSEELVYNNDTTIIGGEPLVRGQHYRYTMTMALNGEIEIIDATVRAELTNTVRRLPGPKGFLNVTYTNVSMSSSLDNGQVTGETFYRNSSAIIPASSVLDFNNETGDIDITGNWFFGADSLYATYTWSGAIRDAKVTVFYPAEDEAVADPFVTQQDGKASFQLWVPALFHVKVEANTYQPEVVAYSLTNHTTDRVYLTKGHAVRVVVLDAVELNPILASQGLVGVMIDPSPPFAENRIVFGSAKQFQVTFYVYTAVWRLIIDANGYEANSQLINVAGNQSPTVRLQRSPEERFEATFAFSGTDWGNITVWRNLTLRQDSSFPGIPFGNLRNLTWQIDLFLDALGTGTAVDGVLGAGERTAFGTYLTSAGPFYAVTDNVFTVNGKAYRSNATTYSVGPVFGSDGGLVASGRATYALNDPTKPIPEERVLYFVNVTGIADKNVTVYQNYTSFVELPRTYEMTKVTKVGNLDTRNFTRVEVDPRIDTAVPSPRANMEVRKSLTGIARIEVEGPTGKVFVNDSNFESYEAWVANDTAIVFSANKTTDFGNTKVNADFATFDWEFRIKGGAVVGNETEIWTTFDFGNVSGEYVVNLTVTQVNPDNVTWREIDVIVDNLAPTPLFKTNRTGNDLPPARLDIDEDLSTQFDGRNSTDFQTPTIKGAIAEWEWDFDGDGTVDQRGSTPRWTYDKPGNYSMNLTVVDRVGHRSANLTMAAYAKDVTPPVATLVIFDTTTWREVSQLVEGKQYAFNANGTTDNGLNKTEDNVNLTYTWEWGDGTQEEGGVGELNLTHTYTKFGTPKLNLTVTDLSGNDGELNQTVIVQADTTAHPDLSLVAGSFKVDPTGPEEGQRVKFSVKVLNANGRANATDLKVELYLIKGTETLQEITNVLYTDQNGTTVPARIDSGKNISIAFEWNAPSPPGNYSVKVKVFDGNEPPTWITGGNEASANLAVKEAGWKIWAIVGGVLFFVIGVPTILYLVRKFRAGELSLPRRKRGEEEEGEEEEEDDEDEDEGEEGGKKRL